MKGSRQMQMIWEEIMKQKESAAATIKDRRQAGSLQSAVGNGSSRCP